MPLPTGFLLFTDKFIIAFVDALEIKSKCGVCPLITHPSARNASYFLIFFEIVTGISNTPGTDIILIIFVFGIKLSALFSNPFDISL
jgi:hypothetical protein